MHLDEIEAIPGPGTLTWHPVRAHLGLRAFGTNAYTAQQGGRRRRRAPRREPRPRARGALLRRPRRATFTLDGESFDAPAGTYVFVPDPATHRHAVAQEPGTTVLSFGGPPTFEPSAWEWMFRAVALTESDPAAAREIVEDGLEKHPESPGLRVALARVLLAEGDEAARARRWPTRSSASPSVEDYVRQDAALSGLL